MRNRLGLPGTKDSRRKKALRELETIIGKLEGWQSEFQNEFDAQEHVADHSKICLMGLSNAIHRTGAADLTQGAK